MKMSRDIYDHTHGVPLSEVYHWYVQRLYKYGMYVCGDREFVLDAITQLFVHVRSQGEPLVNRATLRFCLFKRFRDLISTYAVGDNSPSIRISVTDRLDAASLDMPGLELSRHQREAAFLKLYCEFSYEQVAAIMQLDAEMIYGLVTQSFEILRRQYRKETVYRRRIANPI